MNTVNQPYGKISKKLAGLLILTGLALSFYSLSGFQQSLALKELWNLGHVLLFFLISFYILFFYRFRFFITEFLTAVLLPVLLGLTIELIQPLFGRLFEWTDLQKDLCGSLLAYWFFSRFLPLASIQLSKLFRGLAVLVTIGAGLPFTLAAYDSYQAQQQFPVLSQFDSITELKRFSPIGKHTRLSIENKALIISTNTEAYSGVSMDYLPADWRGYNCLVAEIFIAGNKPQRVTLRIHDAQHASNNFNFNDRFNRSFSLLPGWNKLEITLSDVAQAPAQRPMNMSQIENISLFVIEAPTLTLKLDNLSLRPY